MKLRLPFSNSAHDRYVSAAEMRKTPPCSSSDGVLEDMGNSPYAFNAKRLSESNQSYRTSLWTGKQLQLTVMSIPAGSEECRGLHENADRMITVISGYGEIEITPPRGERRIFSLSDGYAAIIPAGAEHTVRNTGTRPLRLYSVYTRPVYPYGTRDQMKC